MRPGFTTWLLIGVFSLTLGLLVIFMGPFVMDVLRTREVLAHGVAARARIIDMRDTGTRINDLPLIAVTVEVMPSEAPPYVATFRRTLSLADADEFHRGNVIEIKYDPAHPDRIAAVVTGH